MDSNRRRSTNTTTTNNTTSNNNHQNSTNFFPIAFRRMNSNNSYYNNSNTNNPTTATNPANNGTPNGMPQGNPLVESYNAWSERTPFVTKSVTISLVVAYILSFFVTLEAYFGNIPYYTIFRFEIYRLILSPFVGNSILFMILVLISFPSLGTKFENSMGSASFLSLLLILTLVTNVYFVMTCLIMYGLSGPIFLMLVCQDFWTLLFALISIDCFLVSKSSEVSSDS
jgi:membrane associated rhomboid family serine protease